MRGLASGVGIAAAMTVAAHAQSERVTTWTVDGQRRQAIVHTPSSRPSAKAPLVFSFHGRGDDMEHFQQTGMHQAWPEAIVVYFQGLPNAAGSAGWQAEPGQDGDRDLKLVDAALASLRKTLSIDDARIYATGFSNGANFTYLLWAERPSIFAAFAPVAARLAPAVTLSQPKPVFHVAGLHDPQIRFAEQQAAIAAAVRTNHGGEGRSCGSGCTIYGPDTAAPVMTWFHSGGHVYPSTTSDRIARFFREHVKGQ